MFYFILFDWYVFFWKFKESSPLNSIKPVSTGSEYENELCRIHLVPAENPLHRYVNFK